MTCSLVGEGVDVLFVNWECIAVCDTSVIMRNDCCELVHILMTSNICWWILVELMTEFGVSGQISRVRFVVN